MNRGKSIRRIRPGTGKPLTPFRWWQLLSRSLATIDVDSTPSRRYTIDVRHGRRAFSEDDKGIADLYTDGVHTASSKMPAAFPVVGGVIEVADSRFGLRRCRLVLFDGGVRQLEPDPRSAEGRRARFAMVHPVLSSVVAILSILLLLVGVGLNALQAAEPISQIPVIQERLGVFESPVELPLWLNLLLGAGAVAGSTERALRLRYTWLLDAAGN